MSSLTYDSNLQQEPPKGLSEMQSPSSSAAEDDMGAVQDNVLSDADDLEDATSLSNRSTSEDDTMVVDSILTTCDFPDESSQHADDADSKLSDCDHDCHGPESGLRCDLEKALSRNFDDTRPHAFAYGAPAVNAPNPCICVSGLGVLGLPLSEREAKLVIETCKPISHDRCDDTLVGDFAKDVWEIEPTRITFVNPAWTDFMAQTVTNVCMRLGVAAGDTPPRYELSKLSIYQTGSEYSARNQDAETDGVFANIVIVLQSCYTGGEVHVSHEKSTQAFDVASNSLLSTRVLGWYTGVAHEMKPILSGYRLALTYSLMLTADVPRPRPLNIELARAELREVLRNWAEGMYQENSDLKVMVHLFKNVYAEDDLTLEVLQGEDAHRVSSIRSIAAELGYVIAFANLKYKLIGRAETGEDGDGDDEIERTEGAGGRSTAGITDENKESANGGSGEDDDDCDWEGEDVNNNDEDEDQHTAMAEIRGSLLSISNLVDLDGVHNLKVGQLYLEDENLIPKYPFDDSPPDETEYEGPGSDLIYWYSQPVLVIFHKNHALDLLLEAGGVQYALQKLEKNASQDGTEENRRTVDHILQYADVKLLQDKDALLQTANYAVQWNDVAIWKRVVEKVGVDDNAHAIGVLEACRVFPFEPIRSIIEKILQAMPRFKSRMDLLSSFSSTDPEFFTWRKEQVTTSVNALKTPLLSDIPALTSAVVLGGLTVVEDVILPKWSHTPSTFEFWVSLIEKLHKNKDQLGNPLSSHPYISPKSSADEDNPAPENGEPDESDGDLEESSFADVIGQCLNAAIRQWDSIRETKNSLLQGRNPNPKQDSPAVLRVIKLMELCIITDDMAACTRLILVVVRSKGEPKKNFRALYRPLIPKLRSLLKNHKLDISCRPFGDFVSILIGMYLSTVLGAKPRESTLKIRNIGCGCTECTSLDAFMNKDDPEIRFRSSLSRRMHLEAQAMRATDLVTFRTEKITMPHTLVISKRTELTHQIHWQTRLAKAKRFLATIGGDRVISKIMGPRYADVESALNGTQPYTMKLPRRRGDQSSQTTAAKELPQDASNSEQRIGHQTVLPTSDATPTLKRKRDDDEQTTITTPAPEPPSSSPTRHLNSQPRSGVTSIMTSKFSQLQFPASQPASMMTTKPPQLQHPSLSTADVSSVATTATSHVVMRKSHQDITGTLHTTTANTTSSNSRTPSSTPIASGSSTMKKAAPVNSQVMMRKSYMKDTPSADTMETTPAMAKASQRPAPASVPASTGSVSSAAASVHSQVVRKSYARDSTETLDATSGVATKSSRRPSPASTPIASGSSTAKSFAPVHTQVVTKPSARQITDTLDTIPVMRTGLLQHPPPASPPVTTDASMESTSAPVHTQVARKSYTQDVPDMVNAIKPLQRPAPASIPIATRSSTATTAAPVHVPATTKRYARGITDTQPVMNTPAPAPVKSVASMTSTAALNQSQKSYALDISDIGLDITSGTKKLLQHLSCTSTVTAPGSSTSKTAALIHTQVTTRPPVQPTDLRRSPRKLGVKSLADNAQAETSRASSSSSAAGSVTNLGGTSSKSSLARVKPEHSHANEDSSRAKRRKQTHKTHNFVGPVIDMTLMSD